MNKNYVEKVKPEIIILSNLQNYDKKGFEYYNFRRIQWEKEEENTNKTDEEI